MHHNKLNPKVFILSLILTLSITTDAQEISLNGQWNFSIDPLQRGEIAGWHLPWKSNENDSNYMVAGYDKVIVPHNWTLDTRYNIIGKAWYRKGFKLPLSPTDKEVRLRFEAVFYKCRIFVNGQLAAHHYGGYTPFTIDITTLVQYPGVNYLSVEVDNSWDELTIPGARIANNPNASLYPWYESGGIIRDVSLLVSGKVFVSNQKIETKPDLQTGKASCKIITWIQNKSMRDTVVTIASNIISRSDKSKLHLSNKLNSTVTIKAFSQKKMVIEDTIAASEVFLWDFNDPNLYDVITTINAKGKNISEYKAYFGIREFKADSATSQLTLNGKPIRLAGANRHSDHPQFGSTDPLVVAKTDMELIRNGNMIFSRLNHTPASKYFYQWADENGYLIIAEIPNWHISPVLMANRKLKDEFVSQMEEMVETFWNCPSIVAYSTGNEYDSWTPEGDEWTRYQAEQYRKVDSTRLVTFVALEAAGNQKNLGRPHDSFRYCDFININHYAGPEELNIVLQNLHTKYPEKPVFISETGLRADLVKNEKQRIEHLKKIIDIVSSKPYVTGFSYWCFNDYRSRFTNTNENGYREWGLVDAWRKPRDLYKTFQADLSPVKVTIKKNTISIIANKGFPSYTIRHHFLKLINDNKVIESHSLPEINPGQTISVNVKKLTKGSYLQIENKNGFSIYQLQVN